MATVATNFMSRSAVKDNMPPLGCGGGAEFCLKWRHNFLGCPPHVDRTPVCLEAGHPL